MQPWQVLESIKTSEGLLELRQRGEKDFIIIADGRVIMTSAAHRSEVELAKLTCEAIADTPAPKVLVGGLGMGYTLAAALKALPKDAQVEVVELNAQVVKWCRGPLAVLTDAAVNDKRVKIVTRDVAKVIAHCPPGSYDAIILDLYEGPHEAVNEPNDPLYGRGAIANAARALSKKGVFAVWSEERDEMFERRLGNAGLDVTVERSGKGGRQHVVYLAKPDLKAMRRLQREKEGRPRPAGRFGAKADAKPAKAPPRKKGPKAPRGTAGTRRQGR